MNNSIIRIVVYCFVLSVLVSCIDKNEFQPENEPAVIDTLYPSKLYKLSANDLIPLKLESPYLLNDYGLFSYEWRYKSGHSSINDSNIVLNLVKEALIGNSKFSNITSDSSSTIRRFERYSGASAQNSYWEISFENQNYHGHEILNTRVYAKVLDSVEFVIGHHFKDIYIPKENLLPKDSITEKIIGHVIEWSGHLGLQEKEITKGLIVDDYIKKICWVEEEDYIEFRVVWEIPILMYDPILINEGEGKVPVGWHIYIDVLYGDIVYIHQNFDE